MSIVLNGGGNWDDNLKALLQRVVGSTATPFPARNAESVRRLASDPERGVRLLINMGPAALLGLVEGGPYLNAYRASAAQVTSIRVSDRRRQVDAALQAARLIEVPEESTYASVSLEGTGIRFYGEYAVTLHAEKTAAATGFFDRNSYHMMEAPLATFDPKELCGWLGFRAGSIDLVLAFKVLLREPSLERLLTAGQVAEAVLVDEDYVEAFVKGDVTRADLQEVRDSAANAIEASAIRDRMARNVFPTLAEKNWLQRRDLVGEMLAKADIPLRLVTSSARAGRWG